MVDFEGFVPVYNGEVAADGDIVIEPPSGWPTIAIHAHSAPAVRIAEYTMGGFAMPNHGVCIVAFAVHTAGSTVAIHAVAGLALPDTPAVAPLPYTPWPWGYCPARRCRSVGVLHIHQRHQSCCY